MPAALPSSSSTVPGTTATRAWCLSNGKIKLLRMTGTLKKKLKEKFQCKVLVKEMVYPGPSYLSLLQIDISQSRCYAAPAWCFLKGLFDFKIHFGLQLSASTTHCLKIWLKKCHPAPHHLSLWLIFSSVFTFIHSY